MIQNHIRRREKLTFLMTAGAISIGLLVVGGYQLVEFTESNAFCGQLCHTVMYPEYATYQASPHSRVPCAECHVGSGASYIVRSKISGMPQVVSVALNNYVRPIETPVKNLRPARETCEQCHRPEKFSGDLVRMHTTYLTDEKNTEQVDVRVQRVGSGESDTARDIHWHVAARLWYVPQDEKRQDIVWAGIEGKGGYETEYVAPALNGNVGAKRIQNEKRLMDCMDCHNRPTHIFKSPGELIDAAMAQGKVDKTLPYIKREGSRALYPANPSLEEANARVEAVRDFYNTNYPRVYEEKKEAIDAAVKELKEIARLTTFPEMKVTWETYLDNLGHQESSGCFRCHGKLVATTGASKGSVVDAGCESCHYFSVGKALPGK